MHGPIASGLYTTLLNLSPMAYREKTKKEKKERKRRSSYYHYSSLALSGGPRGTDGGTPDVRDSEAQWVQIQRTSISSFIRSALYTDPRNSNSSLSSGKCHKIAVSAS
jgi:hypothetical protein